MGFTAVEATHHQKVARLARLDLTLLENAGAPILSLTKITQTPQYLISH